jgi:hypothetical protein
VPEDSSGLEGASCPRNPGSERTWEAVAVRDLCDWGKSADDWAGAKMRGG